MLRDRAKALSPVTDEMWQEVSEHNRDMVEEFLNANTHLSPKTLKQYTSALRIFFNYVREKLKNKPLYKIKKRDFVSYFGYLRTHQLSSSALKFKKSAVSALCNHIENVVVDDDEDYEGFTKFTNAVKDIPTNKTYEKIPITLEEYKLVVKKLLEKKDYISVAYVAISFHVGSRKSETLRFKKEIVDYKKEEGMNFVMSHTVLTKGRSGGKPVRYMINDDAIKYVKLWLDNRGYEHEYIFTTIRKGESKVVSEGWADTVSKKVANILGRRANIHLFKSSCITNLLEQGVDIKLVSKYVAQHESTETTSLYDLRDDTEGMATIFK